jgi:hypothetical protein
MEFEVRWNNGRLFFPLRSDAMDFAKKNFFETCKVIKWGNGEVIYEVENWKVKNTDTP